MEALSCVGQDSTSMQSLLTFSGKNNKAYVGMVSTAAKSFEVTLSKTAGQSKFVATVQS